MFSWHKSFKNLKPRFQILFAQTTPTYIHEDFTLGYNFSCSLSFCNKGYVCLNVIGPPLEKENPENLRQLLDRVKLFKASLRFLYSAVFVSPVSSSNALTVFILLGLYDPSCKSGFIFYCTKSIVVSIFFNLQHGYLKRSL